MGGLASYELNVTVSMWHRTERLKSYSAAHRRQEGARSEMHAPCPYVLPRAEQCKLAALLHAVRFTRGRQPWSVRPASHLTSVGLGVAVVEIEADVERNAATTSGHLVLSVAYYTVTGSSQVLAILLALFPVTHRLMGYGAYFLLLVSYNSNIFTSTRAKASGLGYLSYVYSGKPCGDHTPGPCPHLP